MLERRREVFGVSPHRIENAGEFARQRDDGDFRPAPLTDACGPPAQRRAFGAAAPHERPRRLDQQIPRPVRPGFSDAPTKLRARRSYTPKAPTRGKRAPV